MEPRLRQLLEELSERLSEAIAESPDVGEKLEEVRSAGYAVYLLLDCKRSESTQALRPPRVATRREIPAGESAGFRINARDLAFLKSVGIDPTRRYRRRR
ncbi:MAG TPA: hypothetical protein VNB06_18005 [Thermoanaerobaculia bacterium]|nr:hypothetical protein [Thermoanaerobaculia bacterium]